MSTIFNPHLNFKGCQFQINNHQICFLFQRIRKGAPQLLKVFIDLQFRAAQNASKEVVAQIVLEDRPIEVTVCTF